MGNSNSGRWAWHTKKYCVEDCLKLPVKAITKYPAGFQGWVKWSTGEEERGRIDFLRLTDFSMRLSYKVKGQAVAYTVSINTTPLPWGKPRLWWTCPNKNCGRRVAHLYIAPGGQYFLCRHCYNLTYRSTQEENRLRGMWQKFASEMQDEFPGVTAQDIKHIFTNG
jgi:hypothetical protein